VYLSFEVVIISVINSNNDEYYLLGCHSMWFGRSSQKFQRIILHPFSGSKNKPRNHLARNKQQAEPHLLLQTANLPIKGYIAE
jgi:hypothetical protein